MIDIKLLLNKQTVRYVVIGSIVYVVELLVILIMQKFKINSMVTIGASFWVGLSISFVLQKIVTFKDKRTKRNILLPQIIAFSLLVLFNFGFTLLVTKLFYPVLPVILIRSIAIAITTVWNFYLYKTRIFKSTDFILLD